MGGALIERSARLVVREQAVKERYLLVDAVASLSIALDDPAPS